MNVETGLFSHMVWQRTKAGVSEAEITGTCDASGVVRACVRRKATILPKLNGVVVGHAAKGKFAACIRGVPTGGSYTVDLWIETKAVAVTERLTTTDVLVGDVWILGG